MKRDRFTSTYFRGEILAVAALTLLSCAALSVRAVLRATRHHPPLVPRPAPPFDLNLAREEDLLTLPGVGPALARRILDERDIRGPYRSAADVVRRVHGLGERTVARWEGRVKWK
jgi:competence protein ComEA